MAVKTTTIHWEVEQELTWRELHSPEGTPSEWWRVPDSRNYTSLESALVRVDERRKEFPHMRVRLIEVETKRATYIQTESGAWRRE